MRRKKGFLYIFFLFLLILTGFFVFFKVGLAQNEDKIELEDQDREKIWQAVKQGLSDELIEISTSSDFKIENQAVLVIIKQAVQVDVINYLLAEVPKEIAIGVIKTIIKLGYSILAQDPSIILEEIEKLSVEKAKEYAMDWLLQKEIKTSSGNLKISYSDYNNVWQEGVFPYIIVYRPIDLNSGEVAIEIYSSKIIRTPSPLGRIRWEGGIEELPPFILRIKGEVEKVDIGLGSVYRWVKGPGIKVVFDEPVPEIEFEEQGFLDKKAAEIKSDLNEAKKVLGNFLALFGKSGQVVKEKVEYILDKIATVFSLFDLFGAKVSPDLGFFEEEEVGQIGQIGQIGQEEEEIEEEEIIEEGTGGPEEFTLEEAQEILDDITERIDILSQKVAEFVGEPEGIGGPIEPIEELEEEETGELEEKEEKEDTEKKEGGVCVVNINTASKEELQKITGVGPVIAQKIIEARPFSSIYDLVRVSGIGEITLQKIIDQGCVYVEYYGGGGGGGGGGSSAQPKITLSYLENNPANKEITATLSLADLKNVLYDVKISIEKEGKVLSDIYNENKTEWQSSFNYLSEVFSNTSFLGNFKLKIKEEKNDFRGEADIIVRVRESGKTKYSEFIGKINLTEPELESEPEADTTPPQVVFNFEPIQTSLSFEISFEITDPLDTVTPSGLDGFIFRWKEEEDWQEDDYQQIEDAPAVFSGEKEFAGEDEKTYYFQIKAKDIAGNESDWVLVQTTIELPEEEQPPEQPPEAILSQTVVINEIAWMGTKANSADEWIELYNSTDQDIDLSGWKLKSSDGGPDIIFDEISVLATTTISTQGFYLLERTDDDTIKDISANWYGSFGNGLGNNPKCEILSLYDQNDNLIDQTACLESGDWPAGKNEKIGDDWIRVSMERIDSTVSGSVPQNWASNNLIMRQGSDVEGNKIWGTPKAKNSVSTSPTEITVPLPFDEFNEITLTFLNSPYIIRWTLNVPQDKILNIEPGVIVKFYDNNSGLTVMGTLKAIGTENEKIIFTSFRENPQPGDWDQIYFDPTSTDSEMINVIVRYGGGRYIVETICPWESAGIRVDQSSIILENSIIEYNKRKGVWLNNSSSRIKNVQFIGQVFCKGYFGEYDGTGLAIDEGDSFVENSVFKRNVYGISIGNAQPILEDLIFGQGEEANQCNILKDGKCIDPAPFNF